MGKKYLIVYHFEDNDGVCSAAIMKYYLVHELKVDEKDIKLFGANYAMLSSIADSDFYYIDENCNEVSLFDFDYFIMLDISFNDFNIMKIMYEHYGNNLIWIDHHAPIINESIKEKYDILINGVRDTHRSAILNAYKYCYDPFDIKYLNGEAPYLLRVLSAWDSFTYEQEKLDFDYVRTVNVGFTNWYELDFDIWYNNIGNFINGSYEYNKEYADEGYRTGEQLVKEYDERNEKLIRNFGMPGFSVDGRPAIMVFMAEGTSSLLFKSVEDKYKNGICAKTSPTGDIIISLYNIGRDDHSFHCGTYLHDKYGGGGHEGAAGCTLSIDEFNKVLKTKNI